MRPALAWPARKWSIPIPSYWHQCPKFLPVTGFHCFYCSVLVNRKEREMIRCLLIKIKLSVKIKSLFLDWGPESRPSVWEVKAAGFEDLLLSLFLQLLALGFGPVWELSKLCPGLQLSEDHRESIRGPYPISPHTDELWVGHIDSNATSPACADHFQLQLHPHVSPPTHRSRR